MAERGDDGMVFIDPIPLLALVMGWFISVG